MRNQQSTVWEASLPEFESKHLRFLTLYSRRLKGRGDCSLYVPPKLPKQGAAMAILLHGAWGSHWDWAFKGGAHLAADRLIRQKKIPPMVLAMPSDTLGGAGTAWMRMKKGPDVEGWLMRELLPLLRKIVPQTKGGPLFIAGLSMGGYTAMRLAATYPGTFSGVAVHSTATGLKALEPRLPKGDLAAAPRPFAEAADFIPKSKKFPPLSMDCGKDDFFFKDNVRLHRQLLKAGVPHKWKVNSGAHGWDYWIPRVPEILRWFASLTAGGPKNRP